MSSICALRTRILLFANYLHYFILKGFFIRFHLLCIMFSISLIRRCFYSKRHGTHFVVPWEPNSRCWCCQCHAQPVFFAPLFPNIIKITSATTFMRSLTFAHVVKRRSRRPSKRNRCTPKTAGSSIQSSQS